MLKKITISLLLTTILLFIACFFIYFKDENSIEININYIDFYVKNKISKIFTNSNVEIQDTLLVLQKDNKDSYLLITSLEIINHDFTINIPKLFIHFKVSSLFKTRINFSQISADNVHVCTRPIVTPAVPVSADETQEKGSIYPNNQVTKMILNQAADVLYIDKKETNFKTADFDLKHSLKAVRELFFSLGAKSKIELANVIVNKSTEDEFFIDKLHIRKREDFNVLNIHVYTKDKKGVLDDLSITIKNRGNLLNVYGTFYHLKLRLFNEFCTLVKNYKLNEDIGFKGSLSAKINTKNEIIDGNVYILNTGNNLNHSNKSSTLNNVNINLIYSNGTISIKNFHFKLNDMYLSLIGKMNLGTNHALLRMNISKFATKDLCIYVPYGVVNDEFKSWCCDNIDGNVLNMIVNFNGKINNLINGNLSDIIVVADIENCSVKFNEDFEEVEELNGDLILKNNNLKIIVNNAKFQNFTINGGNIEMNSLDKESSVLTIHGQAVSDAYALYEPIKFKLDDIITVKKDKVSGTAESQFSFQIFNLNADNKEVNFLADFHSKIDDLTIYNADIGKYDIRLNFGSDFLNLNSGGVVNNKKLIFDLKSSDKNESFVWELTGDLPAQAFDLGEGMSSYISAKVESVINQDKTGHINGDIDLSELVSDSSYLGWKNQFEDHNKITFSIGLKGADKFSLDKLEIVGSDLDIKFSGKSENGNLYLSSSNFKSSDNNFSIDIESGKEKNAITIYGERINLSDILDLLAKNNNESSSNIEINMNVDNVIMNEGITIGHAKLNLICTKGDCNGSQFTGKFLEDNSDIFAEYSEIGLEIYVYNIGMLLRSLGINKSVKSGRMSLYLSPKREDKKNYGMISISNFYIKGAPLLTTLLSMSSLHGIVNAINKEGIYFYKYDVPFLYNDGTIEIEESWLEGAELGISTSGKLDIKDYKFQVMGQVIPVHSVQRSLAKIPIIGKFLTGGKSRGILAIDYKANGDNKNSNVSVDPISSFTPGLLKRILGTFDHIMTKTNKTIRNNIPKQSNKNHNGRFRKIDLSSEVGGLTPSP
ncbi:MAG: AsmA-like C-terminal domain-containing protein [Wolbachia sp.]|nr:AsmA-like C-terminal domain-containing protein [Wolbachia sp.]